MRIRTARGSPGTGRRSTARCPAARAAAPPTERASRARRIRPLIRRRGRLRSRRPRDRRGSRLLCWPRWTTTAAQDRKNAAHHRSTPQVHAISVFSFRANRNPSDSAGYARTVPGRICARASGVNASGDAGGKDELAVLAQNDQPVAGQRHGAGAEPILAPAHLARSQFDRAEALAELLAPMEAVQDAVAMDARRVVVGQRLIRRPDLASESSRRAGARRRPVRTRADTKIRSPITSGVATFTDAAIRARHGR